MSDLGLNGLNREFRGKVERVLAALRRKGYQPRVASGLRTAEEQAEKLRQGVSQTLNSKHISGRAADIIDRRYGWNVPNDSSFWRDLGEAAKKEGLVWGGDWGFYDPAHIEMPSVGK